MNPYYYYCELCDHSSQQKCHNDAHIMTNLHIQKCNVYKCNVLEKTDLLSLINEYKVSLNGTIHQIYDNILLQKSQLKLTKEEVINKQKQLKKISAENQIPIVLNHELTQFTIGKTDQTLNQVSERYLLNSNEIEDHLIEVIITNNSLPETEQWKVRTKNKFGENQNISIDILSSSKDSDFNNIDGFISKIIRAKNRSELPNVLIVCFHKKRVCDDLFKLFDTFCGGNYLLNSTKLKFYLNFDEPDANLGITSTFLSRYKKYEHIISGIMFITATPYDQFWDMLIENEITQLLSLQSKSNISEESYEEYLQNYRSVKNHKFIAYNNETLNPLEYISRIFESTYRELDASGNEIGEFKPYINETKPYIIFAPAHLYTETLGVGSHEEIVDYFTSKGDTVYLSNGKFKGFVDPSGARQLLTSFNEQYEIVGELRDSLRKWRQLNPRKNIVITGYWTIERGITFCTDGFNFDYAILSMYHLNKLNKLVQLIGRTTGGKKYVNEMIIICPKIIYDTVNSLVENTISLRKLNPQNYNKTDFSLNNSAIPVMVEFLDESYRTLLFNSITGRKNYKDDIHKKLIEGIVTKKIKITDKNNFKLVFEDKNKKIEGRKIKGVKNYMKERINKDGEIKEDKIEVRRFKEFKTAFDLCKPSSQTCNSNEYCIDFAQDDYINGDFTNNKNIAWITFKY
jgi:hypothetical protein